MATRWFPDGMPQPMSDTETLPWWEAAARHELMVQRCSHCGYMRLPPAPVCGECQSFDLHLTQVSGRGEVYTYTIVHRPIAMDQTVPFVIAVIDLEGAPGVRLISNLVEIDPDEVAIGLAVEVAWEDMSDDLSLPRFKRAED